MQDGTYLKSNTGEWLPVVQSSGYYVAVRKMYDISDLLNDDEYLGVWTDPTNGTLYLDASVHVADKWEALEMAHAGGELAIWDIARGAEILTAHGMKARELAA